MMLRPTCQRTIIVMSIDGLVANGIAASNDDDRISPVQIHGCLAFVTSLAQPNPMLARLADIAPAKAASASILRALSPARTVARTGSNIVRNGI